MGGWDSREMSTPDLPRRQTPPEVPAQEGLQAPPWRSHCATMAQAHGGRLPEHLLSHFAGVFNISADVIREEFGDAVPPAPVAPEVPRVAVPQIVDARPGQMLPIPPPEMGDAAAHDRVRLPDSVRSHCAMTAQAHGGRIPEALLPHLAGVFNVSVDL